MNNGPMVPGRVAQPIEEMIAGTDDVLNVDKIIERLGEQTPGGEFKPSNDVAELFYLMYSRADSREAIEWLFNLTVRAPEPLIQDNFERAALLAARRQARQALGDVLAHAIALGEKIHKAKTEKGA